AHNPPALERLLETLQDSPWKKTAKVFVFSAYRDKDYREVLNKIRPWAKQIIFCTLPGSRALPARTSAAVLKRAGVQVDVVSDPHRALQTALRAGQEDDLIVVTGSLALVGLLSNDVPPETPERYCMEPAVAAHV